MTPTIIELERMATKFREEHQPFLIPDRKEYAPRWEDRFAAAFASSLLSEQSLGIVEVKS
jgi:hypothetical protein